MGCEPFEMEAADGGKIRGFICSRGRAPAKRCGCGKQSKVLCDFPVRSVPQARLGRRKTKPTCSAPLCGDCSTHVGPDRDLCGLHARMVRAAGVAPELLADPNPDALDVAADLCEQRGLLRPAPPPPPRRRKEARGRAAPAPSAPAAQRGLFDRRASDRPAAAQPAPRGPAPSSAIATSSPGTCRPGDGAAALRELERLAGPGPKDEVGDFAGAWTRSRSDCLDVDAVDYVLAPDETFRPRSREEWEEYVAERAAIFEYLAGRPRAAAEMMARQLAGPPPRHGRHGPLFAGAR